MASGLKNDLAIIEHDIELLASFRKQLFESGSLILTTEEHDQSLNHVANTLFAFRIYLELNFNDERVRRIEEIKSVVE